VIQIYQLTKITSLIALILLCVSCSGGGGDDGESGGGNASSARTGVRVLHGSIDLPPVFVSTSTGSTLEQVRFNQSSVYGGLNTGAQTLTLQTVGGTESFSFPVTVEKNQRRSLLVYGTRETFGVRASLFSDEKPELSEGFAAIRVIHSVAGAAALSGRVGGEVVSANFGGQSGYLTVPAGSVQFSIARAADGRGVFSGTKEVLAKKAYTLLINGEIGYAVFSNFFED